jgi:hypothetical protein
MFYSSRKHAVDSCRAELSPVRAGPVSTQWFRGRGAYAVSDLESNDMAISSWSWSWSRNMHVSYMSKHDGDASPQSHVH